MLSLLFGKATCVRFSYFLDISDILIFPLPSQVYFSEQPTQFDAEINLKKSKILQCSSKMVLLVYLKVRWNFEKFDQQSAFGAQN